VTHAFTIGGGLLACALVAALCFAAPNFVAPELGMLGIGVPLVWLSWKRPEVGVLGLVTLTAGLLPLSSLYVPLAVGGVFDYDIALIGLLGLLSLRGLIYDGLRIEWWPVSKPLLIFLALAIASVVYAVSFREVDLARSLNELRPFVYYGASIVVAMALTRPSHRTTLLIGLFVLADIVSAALIFAQFAGAGQLLFPGMAEWQVNDVGAGGVTDTVSSQSSGFGLLRIVPPAAQLMFLIMILAFIWALAPGLRPAARIMCAAQCAFLNLGLLLTYTRAQWIATVISVMIIAALVPHALRVRLGHGLVGVLGITALVFGLFQAGVELPAGAAQPAVEAMLGRATSILSPDATLNSASLQWRVFENEEAFNSIVQSPQGVGLGNTYRAITTYAGEAAGYQGSPLNGFMHNSYLYIAVKMGLQGLIAFLWFCVAVLVHGWRLFRKMPSGPDKWLVLAVLASFVGIMQWSITEPNFMQTGATITVGLMVGLLASLTTDAAPQGNPSLAPEGTPSVDRLRLVGAP
jgi:O-antigen ligase